MVEAVAKVVEVTVEEQVAVAEIVNELDQPLGVVEVVEYREQISETTLFAELDRPLCTEEIGNVQPDVQPEEVTFGNIEMGIFEKMDNPVVIEFKCPEGMDRREFTRQVKGQEIGLNNQTVAENMDNRAAYEQRKVETGNGRDLSEGNRAQDEAREKALMNKIAENQEKGMSYSDAKAEAEKSMKSMAVLHEPDQIAGGDPGIIAGIGDADVNRSIGSQWRSRVDQLAAGVDEYAKGKSREELENTRMNVKLVVI